MNRTSTFSLCLLLPAFFLCPVIEAGIYTFNDFPPINAGSINFTTTDEVIRITGESPVTDPNDPNSEGQQYPGSLKDGVISLNPKGEIATAIHFDYAGRDGVPFEARTNYDSFFLESSPPPGLNSSIDMYGAFSYLDVRHPLYVIPGYKIHDYSPQYVDNIRITTESSANIIKNPSALRVFPSILGQGVMTAQFIPTTSTGLPVPLDILAHSLGYDHFNWLQFVTSDPVPPKTIDGHQLPNTEFMDPPGSIGEINGFLWPDGQKDYFDDHPGYYDEEYVFGGDPDFQLDNWIIRDGVGIPTLLEFKDIPMNDLGIGQRVEFITMLIGVKENGYAYSAIGPSFNWYSTYTGKSGNVFKLPNVSSPGEGTGDVGLIGVYNSFDEIPDSLLTKLRDAGIQGIPEVSSVPEPDTSILFLLGTIGLLVQTRCRSSLAERH